MQRNQNSDSKEQTAPVPIDNSDKPEQSQPAPQKPEANTAPQNPMPANIYPDTSSSTPQNSSMSASQMGLNYHEHKFFDFNAKKLFIKILVFLLLAGGVFAGLVFANVVSIGRFKTISYDNNKGGNYSLKFYKKYSTKEMESGTRQLVSKTSKDNKFPLVFMITKAPSASVYDRLKNCTGFRKIFDAQNDNLGQKISVCDIVLDKSRTKIVKGTQNGVYIAGFTQDDISHIITISQDYSDIDLSNRDAAQEALTKFGLDAYEKDIKTIISSINTE